MSNLGKHQDGSTGALFAHVSTGDQHEPAPVPAEAEHIAELQELITQLSRWRDYDGTDAELRELIGQGEQLLTRGRQLQAAADQLAQQRDKINKTNAATDTLLAEADGKTCPLCGGSTVEYPHILSKPQASSLLKLYRAGGRSAATAKHHATDLTGANELTHSQKNNLQKLRYHGLIDQPDDNRNAGRWYVTDLGIRWLHGEAMVPLKVWSYRKQWHHDDEAGKLVSISDVLGSNVANQLSRSDYSSQARPHQAALDRDAHQDGIEWQCECGEISDMSFCQACGAKR